MAKAKKAVPEGHHTVTPVLTLDNAAQAIEWYKKAFGAQEVSRATGPDGKIMHAEIRIGDSPVMLNDAMMGNRGPKALGGSPASIWLYVDDCDALFKSALAAGGEVYGGGMGNPNGHASDPLPCVAVGGGVGKGHRHIQVKKQTPVGNLWLSVANQFGSRIETFGDSNGRVEDFFA